MDNAQFAATVDDESQALKNRMEEALARHEAGQPTVPTVLSVELETNPFLKVRDPAFRETFQLDQNDEVSVFAALRRWKDQFNMTSF